MIDIHSHVIFGVDDGPSTLEESIKMIRNAAKAGVNTIIATPHLKIEPFDVKGILVNYNTILNRIAGSHVELLLGYEVLLNPFTADMLEENNITLNNSKYLLFELPFDLIPLFSFEVISKLQLRGIVPILAHPERNRSFLKDFQAFSRFYEKGCLIQLDAASIMGAYGHQVKQFVKHIIKNKMAHFIASDAHNSNDYARWYQGAYFKVEKWSGVEYAELLFGKNAAVILEDSKENSI